MARSKAREPRWPDGIAPDHAAEGRPLHRHASPLSLLVLGLVVGWGLSGFAGNRSQHPSAETPALVLAVDAPSLIRNGEYFESTVALTAKKRIAKLVIVISPSLLREITMNSMTPAADKENSQHGLFRFSYGSVENGEVFVVKMDFQINHSLFGTNAGSIAVFDGDERLAEVPLRMRVLP